MSRVADEIEITPVMVQAGAEIIWRTLGDVVPYGSSSGPRVAAEVYRAMRAASAEPLPRIEVADRNSRE